MAFTKITNADFNDNGALSMPNRPSETKSAQEIKRLFDAPAREVVAPAYNRLIDELEAETGAASIGAVAPTGASGNTVQEILNGVYGAISTAVVDVREIKEEIEDLSEEVGTFADDIETLQQEAHTHSNKDLLDTYNNTNLDITQAVLLKHEHQNKDLLDTYTNTNADISGAIAKSHDHTNKALLDSYVVPNETIEDTVYKTHTHSNKSVLDLLGEDFSISITGLTYDGQPVGNVITVNGKTGIVVLDASDVNALPNTTTLADLDDDSTHRLVTDAEKTNWDNKSFVYWQQLVNTGTKIATVSIDGTTTDVYAPNGGGGGGSVDNAYKIVKVGSTNITASGEDTIELVAGSNVTLTPDASLKKVTIAASGGGGSTGDMLASDYDSDLAVKTAGGIKSYVSSQIARLMVKNTYDSDSAVANAGGIARYVSSQISAQITSALTASY